MNKGGKVLVIILIIVAVLAAAAYFFIFAPASTTPAYLYVDEGNVEVDTGNGWQKALNEMELSIEDSIRTLAGKATLVLYESEMLRLEPNTVMKIKDLSKDKLSLSQSSGKTWSKVSKLTGVSSYEIETPDTVATVRGTGFATFVTGEGTSILVGEGTVKANDEDIKENNKVKASKGKILEKLGLDDDDKAFISRHKNLDLETLKKVRLRMIQKNKMYNLAKKFKKFDESKLEEGLRKVDSGEIKEEDLLAKYPIKGKEIERIRKINSLIREKMR